MDGYDFRWNDNNWHEWGRGSQSGWTIQEGKQSSQLFAVLSTNISGFGQYTHADGGMKMVYHEQGTWNLYPVSSTSSDPLLATGWYEGHYVLEGHYLNTIDPWVIPPFVGHVTAVGRGDFTGQTLQGTVGPELSPQTSLCPEGPASTTTLTLQIVGKP
jgi:hypothetical protein